jgi:hypothetical protein
VGLRHRVPANRQHFAATYVLPTELADRIRREYPDPLDAGPALQGLRQWLRLAILTDEPMGMPSLSVQSALAHFLSYGKAVDAFRRGACNLVPHLPQRIPHQIHFGLRPPHPLMDKSDAPFGGGAL